MPRYKVTLELEEREQLEQLTRKGKVAASKLILPELGETMGWLADGDGHHTQANESCCCD